MKIDTALILAGGRGTRFLELTRSIPKPMIEAAGKPLLSHIIDIYQKKSNVRNFYILAGYKKEVINDFFKSSKNYETLSENSFKSNKEIIINILDTGQETMTGGRIMLALKEFDSPTFHLTYGDGVSTIDINDLERFHFESNKIATITSVNPKPRWGKLEIKNNLVTDFTEKKEIKNDWINAGFFVLNRGIEKFLKNLNEPFEREPLQELAKSRQLAAYKYSGYWHCVDTIRELEILEKDIENGNYK